MAKKIKEKLAQIFSEQAITAATDQSDNTLQSALDTLQQAASSCSISCTGKDTSNVTIVGTSPNNNYYDSSGIIGDSYTLNGYGNYNNYSNYSWSNIQPHVKVQADSVYVEFNGVEYRLSDLMAKLNILDDLMYRYPNLIAEFADMTEKLNKIQEELALQKLDQVINS